jgi:hypothetical protein
MRRADPSISAPKLASTFVVARLGETELDVVMTVSNRRVLWQRT